MPLRLLRGSCLLKVPVAGCFPNPLTLPTPFVPIIKLISLSSSSFCALLFGAGQDFAIYLFLFAGSSLSFCQQGVLQGVCKAPFAGFSYSSPLTTAPLSVIAAGNRYQPGNASELLGYNNLSSSLGSLTQRVRAAFSSYFSVTSVSPFTYSDLQPFFLLWCKIHHTKFTILTVFECTAQ